MQGRTERAECDGECSRWHLLSLCLLSAGPCNGGYRCRCCLLCVATTTNVDNVSPLQEEGRNDAKKKLELLSSDLNRLFEQRHVLLRKPRSEQVWRAFADMCM